MRGEEEDIALFPRHRCQLVLPFHMTLLRATYKDSHRNGDHNPNTPLLDLPSYIRDDDGPDSSNCERRDGPELDLDGGVVTKSADDGRHESGETGDGNVDAAVADDAESRMNSEGLLEADPERLLFSLVKAVGLLVV